MISPVITLTTDFGTSDPYVGIMKGVILGINPEAAIVDISHEVGPQSIPEGAFVIGTSHRYFPRETVHVVVVDPGVGTSRDALLVTTPTSTFLAPDNGVLSYVIEAGFAVEPEIVDGSHIRMPPGYEAYRLTNSDFWLQPVSSTFHGRDIFAPAAAHLTLGVPPRQLGQEVSDVQWLPHGRVRQEGDILEGEVVHVDRFGNLISNIPADLLLQPRSVEIEVKGRRIQGLSRSYAEGGELLAIVGSHGNLEMSVKNGNAAHSLGASVGDAVRVYTI